MQVDLIKEKLLILKSLKGRDFIKFYFLFYHSFKYGNVKLLERLQASNLDEFDLEKIQFKKVKGKALLALRKWLSEDWQFVALDYIPSPYEVLEYQAQGIRPVTVIVQDQFEKILNRDDCLEFFLHDLEHGHMFFFDNELKEMQIRFFGNISRTLGSGLWREYLKDEEFKKNFYYLISDMNTHEEHYKQYLKATLPGPEDFSKFEVIFS